VAAVAPAILLLLLRRRRRGHHLRRALPHARGALRLEVGRQLLPARLGGVAQLPALTGRCCCAKGRGGSESWRGRRELLAGCATRARPEARQQAARQNGAFPSPGAAAATR
jgi:hypothetical protein